MVLNINHHYRNTNKTHNKILLYMPQNADTKSTYCKIPHIGTMADFGGKSTDWMALKGDLWISGKILSLNLDVVICGKQVKMYQALLSDLWLGLLCMLVIA